MLKSTLTPISKLVLKPADQKDVDFDSFFTHILAHEITHGLGPHSTKVDGKESTPRQDLKDTYSTIEEAKADITGLWALGYMMDKGLLKDTLGQGAAAEEVPDQREELRHQEHAEAGLVASRVVAALDRDFANGALHGGVHRHDAEPGVEREVRVGHRLQHGGRFQRV